MVSISTIHYNDVMMDAMASQITSLTIVYSTVYTGADQRKHQSSALLAFVWGIQRWPVNSPHKQPVTRKMFPFDDVIMWLLDIRLGPLTDVFRRNVVFVQDNVPPHVKNVNLDPRHGSSSRFQPDRIYVKVSAKHGEQFGREGWGYWQRGCLVAGVRAFLAARRGWGRMHF